MRLFQALISVLIHNETACRTNNDTLPNKILEKLKKIHDFNF